ncbi:hypothetical protein Tco_1131781 [Tanacetum coccineum]|uniref:Uncharacterized protein n=1 Tax=Tanacetum coccineum TaxID=301880 RepID=A0ABQ5JBF2_9ASTR
MGEGSTNPTDPHHTPTFIQPSTSQPQKKQKPRKPKRKDTQIPQSSGPTEHVADEAVYKELDDSLVRAATTASSLEAEQDSAKLSNDPLLARGNTLQSGEDSLKLKELMELCTNLQTRVLDLETTKTTQANEIDSLKRRVKRLEKKKRSRTHRLKRLYKVGLSARVEFSGDEEDLGRFWSRMHSKKRGEEKGDVIEEPSVPVSTVSASTKDSAATTTTATILTPRKRIIFQESGTTTTTIISSQQPSQANVQDKGKGKMVEPEKPIKKKELTLQEIKSEREKKTWKRRKIKKDSEGRRKEECAELRRRSRELVKVRGGGNKGGYETRDRRKERKKEQVSTRQQRDRSKRVTTQRVEMSETIIEMKERQRNEKKEETRDDNRGRKTERRKIAKPRRQSGSACRSTSNTRRKLEERKRAKRLCKARERKQLKERRSEGKSEERNVRDAKSNREDERRRASSRSTDARIRTEQSDHTTQMAHSKESK